jgi:hypothetical protein
MNLPYGLLKGRLKTLFRNNCTAPKRTSELELPAGRLKSSYRPLTSRRKL